MFYDNPSFFFRILGIFYVEREPEDKLNTSHSRTHSGISFRKKGGSTIYTNDKEFNLDTGTVAYIPDRINYRHINHVPEKIIILHLYCPPGTEPSIQTLHDCMDLEPLFDTLLEIWEEGGPHAYSRCMSLLYQIFEQLQEKSQGNATRIPPVISSGVEMLRKNFRNPKLTISNLAAKCFVSEVYFRRVYHSHFGESPLQTIRNLRFQYACSLLRSGYYTCKQIAELSGFSDVKYFRTTFKKQFGKTPLEYSRSNNTDP